MQIKRHFMRWSVDAPVHIRHGGVDRFLNATIHDISLMGMQISLDEELPRERSFAVTVRCADGFQWKADSWVAWHSREEGRNLYGLYFTRITDSDKEKVWQFIDSFCHEEVSAHRWQSRDEQQDSPGTADRRIFQRFPLHCPLIFSDSPQGRRYNAQVVDFSAKGIGMISPVTLPQDARLQMLLHFPGHEQDISTHGRVAWQRVLDDGRCRVGVEFDTADLMGIPGLIR